MTLIVQNFSGFLPNTGEQYKITTSIVNCPKSRCKLFTAKCVKQENGSLLFISASSFDYTDNTFVNPSFEDAAREALQKLSDEMGVPLMKAPLKHVV